MNAGQAVVIGTGAGGLTAAAYLAKAGFEVTALERSDRIGGFLAPFEVDGFSFDPGLHYVGQARAGQLLDDLLWGLGLGVQRMFVEMDPDGFDAYRFPNFEIRMCRGLSAYAERLIERFPDDRHGIGRILRIAGGVEGVMRLAMRTGRPQLSELAALRHLPTLMRWGASSFSDLLGHSLHDARARAVLAAPGGDLGLPPSRLPALAGLGLLSHYGDGAFYPRGGSGALRDALVQSAEQNGARFRTHSEVDEILVSAGRVTGVILATGEQFDADVVVSDADPTLTFGKMTKAVELPRRLLGKVERTVPSIGSFTIFLGLKRDLRSHGFGAFNVWEFPTWDLDALYDPVLRGVLPEQFVLFLSSSTARDDTGKLAPPGASTLQIVTFLPYEPFARWATVPPSERGEEYRDLLQSITEQLLAQVERRWPGLVGDVVVQRVATPLSNADYCAAVRGGTYGPALSLDQFGPRRFGTTTPIHGLFLAGSGVYGPGVAPCLASGRAAARAATASTLHRAESRKGTRVAAQYPA